MTIISHSVFDFGARARRSIIRGVFLISGLSVLAGCDDALRGEPEASFDPSRNLAEVVVNETLDVERIRSLVRRGASQSERNEIVYARLTEIDTLYHTYERSLSNELRRSDFIVTLAQLAIGGTGALVGTNASQILSAVSAGLSGTKKAFDKDILVDRTVSAFVSQMRANRDRVKANILPKLRSDTQSYPLTAALSDLSTYRQAGTLTGALNGISEIAKIEEKEARESLQTTEAIVILDRREVLLSNVARNVLGWLNEDGLSTDQKDARNTNARTCFNESSATNKPPIFTLFLTDSDQFPELERDLVSCLNTRFSAGIRG